MWTKDPDPDTSDPKRPDPTRSGSATLVESSHSSPSAQRAQQGVFSEYDSVGFMISFYTTTRPPYPQLVALSINIKSPIYSYNFYLQAKITDDVTQLRHTLPVPLVY